MKDAGDMPLKGKRLLVVEDEVLIAMMLQQMLEELGCERVEVAHSVAQAYTALDADTPDCVLLDLNLGREYSFEIGDHLRSKNVPYVFCTAHSTNIELFFPNDGATPCVGKPTTKRDLKIAIGKALVNGQDSRAAPEARKPGG
jgi:CheY-like chemotaxis protein